MTIEDETGVANLVIWQAVFEPCGSWLGSDWREGGQREGEVIHVVGHQLHDRRSSPASDDATRGLSQRNGISALTNREKGFPRAMLGGEDARV